MNYDVVILGAGISGLSCAWYLKKKHPHYRIKILEQSQRPGGWIHTWHSSSGQLYETGPRSFRGSAVRELIHELSLDDDVILASEKAKKRFLLLNNKLTPLPHSLKDLVFSSLGRKVAAALCRDLFCRPSQKSDESVFSFFSRRYGAEFAEKIADSLVTGIYATDSKKLSMASAFKQLWKWQKSGPLLFGRCKDKQASTQIATLKNGMSSLTDRLSERLAADIAYSVKALSLHERESDLLIETSMGPITADRLISTLPEYAYAKLLGKNPEVEYTSLATISVGFEREQTIPSGFGFLAPTLSHPELLGVIFDSHVFPQQTTSMPSRCCFMFGGARSPNFCRQDDLQIMQKVRQALEQYLLIHEAPTEWHISRAVHAIPSFPVGHQLHPKPLNSKIICTGSWISGVSLADCILTSKNLSYLK